MTNAGPPPVVVAVALGAWVLFQFASNPADVVVPLNRLAAAGEPAGKVSDVEPAPFQIVW